MEIRVLGPVEVLDHGRSVRFARRQQRLILGVLALHRDQILSPDRLTDLVWGDRPPARARAVLQTRISEIRATINTATPDPGLHLSRMGEGYVLRASPEQVDASLFTSLLSDAHDARSDDVARDILRRALALWRGPVFGVAGLTEEQIALCYPLESARLTAQEDLFDIELRLGNPLRVVDEIVTLSGAHPTRERLFALMMLALHRAGRSAEALAAHDRWRRWLSDELGADPGIHVRQAHLMILHGDADAGDERATAPADVPEPGFRASVPRTLPPDVADFTGREREVVTLQGLLRRATPGVVAVSGRGGVGKTALCVHVAHGLREHYPDGQLYASLRGAGDDDPPKPTEVLARFLRSLGVDGTGLPAGLDERVELYRDLLSDRRVLVVLDNAATAGQVLPLIPGGSGCGVLLNSRARFGSTVGAQTLDLDVFDPDEAVGLLTRIAGKDRVNHETDATADLALHCGHLPLALRIAGAKLVAKPHWQVQTLVDLLRRERHRLDQFANGHLDVRASIALSYAGLTTRAQRLLRLVGDIEVPEVTVWISAALLDTSEADAEELLEQLFDAQLLDAVEPRRYRLHDLVRLFAREQAESGEPPDVLAEARARVFHAWLFIVDAAYAAVHGGGFQNIAGPAQRRPVGRREIAAIVANPSGWFEAEWPAIVAMVRRAALDGRVAECWELASTASPFFEMRRYFDEWIDMLDVAAEATAEDGHDRGHGAILYRLGVASISRMRYERAAEYLTSAVRHFDAAGDLHGVGVATTYLAVVQRFAGDAQAEETYRRGRQMLQATRDHGGEAFALRGVAQIQTTRRDLGAAEESFEQALAIYRANGARVGEAQVLFWHGMLRLDQARFTEAKENFETALATCRAIGDRPGEAYCLRGIALFYQSQGDRDAAARIFREVLQLVCQPHPTHMETLVRREIAELQSC